MGKTMILTHKTHLPSFGVHPHLADQTPVCLLTVLSINHTVKDCAAYRGVVLDMSRWSVADKNITIEKVRAGGNKRHEEEARSLFQIIMAKATAKQELTVAEKLVNMFNLQTIDSELDKIEILKGELPIEVDDLEDEIAGLDTRINRLSGSVDDNMNEIMFEIKEK